MARIIHRDENFTGRVGRCEFTGGEGETDIPSLVAYFERHPDLFEVHHDEAPAPEGDPEDNPEGDESEDAELAALEQELAELEDQDEDQQDQQDEQQPDG